MARDRCLRRDKRYLCSDKSSRHFGESMSWIRCLCCPHHVLQALAVSWAKDSCGCAACRAFGLFSEWFLSVALLCTSELHYQRCTSISPWRPSTCQSWCGRLLENVCALNVVGFIVVEVFLFVCLFCFLVGVGFIMSSGPTSGSCGGIEPLVCSLFFS